MPDLTFTVQLYAGPLYCSTCSDPSTVVLMRAARRRSIYFRRVQQPQHTVERQLFRLQYRVVCRQSIPSVSLAPYAIDVVTLTRFCPRTR